ncbi:MAG: hypothetical protein BWX86_02370 [Verrucomicrobia bacterium ADurb.Bin122]|nr:MAG: hypothetical protein BWX86_02370 [Verrucomicrobia bacterium ADurb.Bin122]
MQIQATTKSLLILAAALGLGASAATAKDAGKLGFVFEAGASYVLTGYDVKANATYQGTGVNDAGVVTHTGTVSYATHAESGDLDGGAGVSAFMGLSLGAHDFGVKGVFNDGGCFKWGNGTNGTIVDNGVTSAIKGIRREVDLEQYGLFAAYRYNWTVAQNVTLSAGLSVGAIRDEFSFKGDSVDSQAGTQKLGYYNTSDARWNFAFGGELGAEVALGKGWSLRGSAELLGVSTPDDNDGFVNNSVTLYDGDTVLRVSGTASLVYRF